MKQHMRNLFNKSRMDEIIRPHIQDCKTILDLGCGNSNIMKRLNPNAKVTGIDAFDKNEHYDFSFKLDLFSAEKKFKKDSFDCVSAIGVIEHLEKKQGHMLLDMMRRLAKKKIIIHTPNGFVEQKAEKNNPYQLHKSGWSYEEFKKMGFKVYGLDGFKFLRINKYPCDVKWRPRWFWLYISNLSQLYTKTHAKNAYQLLCVKTLKK